MNVEKKQAREHGYSLIEVLVATAILGTVLLSILTLFFFGRRNVYSGKQLTRATSVATHAAEDLSAMSADEVWHAFKISNTSTVTTTTIDGVEYKDVIVRTTDDAGSSSKEIVPSDPEKTTGLLTRWKALIPASAMDTGKLTLIFTPTELATAGDVTSAQVVRVRILMQWNEAQRARRVTLDTIKLNRV
jgi:prepilin-type N-terminal cleavage/methylation domain-containing protein